MKNDEPSSEDKLRRLITWLAIALVAMVFSIGLACWRMFEWARAFFG